MTLPPRIYSSGSAIFLDFGEAVRRYPLTEAGLTSLLHSIPILAPQLTSGTNLLSKVAPTTKTKRTLKRIGSVEMKALAQEVIRGVEVRYK